MGTIICIAKQKYRDNNDFSSFNCIERGSLVRSDDAVEAFKRHSNYKTCTALNTCHKDQNHYAAEPELIWLQLHPMHLVDIHQKR